MNHSFPTRREFLRNGLLVLGATGTGSLLAADPKSKPVVKLGLMTDLHYGDKPPGRTRHYRDTLDKLAEAVAAFDKAKVDLAVCLGDFIDQAESVEEETKWLQTVEGVFAKVAAPRHYVLGNHCVGTLTKAEFAAETGAKHGSFYSFEQGGVQFIVLDACFRSDGVDYSRANFNWTDANIPAHELEWLRGELKKGTAPVVVLAHQRLDDAGKHGVNNAEAVRAELEKSGRVLAVFQGHSHQNAYAQIAGIHYTTLVAMVEGQGEANSGYATLEIMPDRSMRLQGFRRQASRELSKA